MPRSASWHTPLCLAPPALRPWLTERGSLTARLMAHFPAFSVRVCTQASAGAHDDERRAIALARRKQQVEAREVLLMSGQTPLVFAHSVLQHRALRKGFRPIGRLGNASLGSFLFATPTIRRSPLAWRQIDARHPLWRKAAAHVADLPARLWARRSLFFAGHDRLLVTEVFLPPAFAA
ncbi:chorismate--pyruvate lyase family protein [Jeongeupia chitinilytica]|uniref:Probable chorismate pyruvate-lyase n=1 Tax=Jeongeupia chitinilytica TaxID=1041641 RepID=A0ABQ3H2Q2_9NEIS|nr:chorismate lyase [Jeongeupia chitinilytica]GHD67237.1 putative chorismate pyruvate-lyase [Jeongeupia chitinilytica]